MRARIDCRPERSRGSCERLDNRGGPGGQSEEREPLLERLHEHRRVWAAKPVLEAVYEEWFDQLLSGTPTGGHVLEVGAGPASSPGTRAAAAPI